LLIQNHRFVDGDKRIAFAVVDICLRTNGHTAVADSGSIYRRMIKLIETMAFDMERLVPWLKQTVRPQ
jgi:death-on-curing protein